MTVVADQGGFGAFGWEESLIAVGLLAGESGSRRAGGVLPETSTLSLRDFDDYRGHF